MFLSFQSEASEGGLFCILLQAFFFLFDINFKFVTVPFFSVERIQARNPSRGNVFFIFLFYNHFYAGSVRLVALCPSVYIAKEVVPAPEYD